MGGEGAGHVYAMGTIGGHDHRTSAGNVEIVHSGEAAVGSLEGRGVRGLAWAGNMLAVGLEDGAVAVYSASISVC